MEELDLPSISVPFRDPGKAAVCQLLDLGGRGAIPRL